MRLVAALIGLLLTVAAHGWADSSGLTRGEIKTPGYLGLTVQPESYLFTVVKDKKTVLSVHSDGRVDWHGDQSEAARAFWQAVERVGPRYGSACNQGIRSGNGAIETPGFVPMPDTRADLLDRKPSR